MIFHTNTSQRGFGSDNLSTLPDVLHLRQLNVILLIFMNVLVLNCGSSSLKFQVIQTDPEAIKNQTDKRLANGTVERIGSQSLITLQAGDSPVVKRSMALRDHRSAIDYILKWLVSDEAVASGLKSLGDIHAVGHRVVHGGEEFTKSIIIDDTILRKFDDLIDLAPLHNPANIVGIRAARDVLGSATAQVAVFDTAYHHTLPEVAYLYAIPYQLYRRYKIRRYGFHGTSHRYVAYRYRSILNIARTETHAISLHMGNGASACAIYAGDSIDTSMGLTPLEGLVMGTRSGDLDPAVLQYISEKEGISLTQVDYLLNYQSGLLGISGLTNDMRELLDEMHENNDRRAMLAIELFCYRARKYIGSYITTLAERAPTLPYISLIFTGGIGENSPEIRSRICSGLQWFGLEIDEAKNQQAIKGWEGEISNPNGKLRAFVIPTNEELLIARDTVRSIMKIPSRF
jgi:acetate kinase